MKRLLILLTLAATLSGCIAIPLGTGFDQSKFADIHIGETSKDEVIEILGEPNILSHSSVAAYYFKGPKIFIMGKTSPAMGTIEYDARVVAIKYDDKNIVTSITTSSPDNSPLSTTKKFKIPDDHVVLDKHVANSGRFEFSPSGRYFVYTKCSAINIYDLNSILQSPAHDDFSQTLTYKDDPSCFPRHFFSHDESLMAVQSQSGPITIYNTPNWNILHKIKSAQYEVKYNEDLQIEFLDGNRALAIGDSKGTLSIINLNTLTPIYKHSHHHDGVVDMEECQGSSHLVTSGNDNSVKVLNTDTQKEHLALTRGYPITHIACSPNGQTIVLSSDYHIEIWNASDLYHSDHNSREPYAVIPLPLGRQEKEALEPRPESSGLTARRGIRSLFFSPDSNKLGLDIGNMVVWDIAENKLDATYRRVKSAAYNQEGELMLINLNSGWTTWGYTIELHRATK